MNGFKGELILSHITDYDVDMGFGLIIGVSEHLSLVTTNNYNTH